MRWLVCLLLLPLAGCVESTDPPVQTAPFGQTPLTVYVPTYPGSDVQPMGTAHHWLAIVSNPSGEAIEYGVGWAPWFDRFGPIRDSGWAAVASAELQVGNGTYVTQRDVLEPGASRLWAFEVATDVLGDVGALLIHFDGQEAQAARQIDHAITGMTPATHVAPGDHVQTVTAGFWLNGTSFYTNIAALNHDPAFPAGYDRAEFGGEPLPIYVYDQDRTEQPIGSKDTCHFTTITGYNALLKTQTTGGTGIRFLAPEEGYTVAGAEGHPLYGDALVFLNTVVGHDGATGIPDMLPAPSGACFDVQNTLDFAAGLVPISP